LKFGKAVPSYQQPTGFAPWAVFHTLLLQSLKQPLNSVAPNTLSSESFILLLPSRAQDRFRGGRSGILGSS
jgi:hypothetical protein